MRFCKCLVNETACLTPESRWTGQEAYAAEEWRDWHLSEGDVKAGETKTFGPLTFATIRGAGHMVPHDKPTEALTMVSRWIVGKAL